MQEEYPIRLHSQLAALESQTMSLMCRMMVFQVMLTAMAIQPMTQQLHKPIQTLLWKSSRLHLSMTMAMD